MGMKTLAMWRLFSGLGDIEILYARKIPQSKERDSMS